MNPARHPALDAQDRAGIETVPVFTDDSLDEGGAQLCPCGIAMATPQHFTMASKTDNHTPTPEFPTRPMNGISQDPRSGRCAPHPAHIHQIRAGRALRDVNAGSSRTPLHHARRTHTIWQYWPGLVRAAPTHPGTSRNRLPSASTPCCDRAQVQAFHLHSNRQRLTAHAVHAQTHAHEALSEARPWQPGLVGPPRSSPRFTGAGPGRSCPESVRSGPPATVEPVRGDPAPAGSVAAEGSTPQAATVPPAAGGPLDGGDPVVGRLRVPVQASWSRGSTAGSSTTTTPCSASWSPTRPLTSGVRRRRPPAASGMTTRWTGMATGTPPARRRPGSRSSSRSSSPCWSWSRSLWSSSPRRCCTAA